MNDIELLQGIANIMDKKFEPLQEDILYLKQEISGVKDKIMDIEITVVDVVQKLTSVEQKVIDIEKKVDDVDRKVDDVDRKVDDVERKVDDVERKVTEVEQQVTEVKKKVTVIEMTLENETNKNIMRIAEGHLDLTRKLNTAIHIASDVQARQEVQDIYINTHESEIRKIANAS